MVNKCCVPLCDGNYLKKSNNGESKVSVYRLPKSEEEKLRWIKAIPRANLEDCKDPFVCERHWPPNSVFIKVQGGHKRPKDPPSVFDNIPKSCLSSVNPPKRSTSKCLSSVRSIEKDQLDEFRLKDQLKFECIVEFIQKNYKNLLV